MSQFSFLNRGEGTKNTFKMAWILNKSGKVKLYSQLLEWRVVWLQRNQYFFLIGIVGSEIHLGPLGTAATSGLLCQSRVIMMMDKLVEWLAGETEVLGKKPAPVPLGPPQIQHDARTRTRGDAVGSPITGLGLALSKGPNRIGFFPHPRTETDPVSETSCFP
jgi:hypothetical protein